MVEVWIVFNTLVNQDHIHCQSPPVTRGAHLCSTSLMSSSLHTPIASHAIGVRRKDPCNDDVRRLRVGWYVSPEPSGLRKWLKVIFCKFHPLPSLLDPGVSGPDMTTLTSYTWFSLEPSKRHRLFGHGFHTSPDNRRQDHVILGLNLQHGRLDYHRTSQPPASGLR